ncbi:MAG: hypothetical protein HZB33_00125 [Nitrospirae bacterium]|nr:hypothetical protein [Nitrospirota bacterium]
MSKKDEVTRLLEGRDFDAVLSYAKKDPGLFRTLISMTYDRHSLTSWRAIEAVGRLAGGLSVTDPGRVRNMAQRLLWMLREESGNNPWSAPDMLGEMVRNLPEQLADLAPIIACFHEEEILRQGVLRAMARIGGVRPDLVAEQHTLVREYMGHADPITRAYAVMLAGVLKNKDLFDLLQPLAGDEAEVRLYEDGEFVTFRIRGLVRKILTESEETDKNEK